MDGSVCSRELIIPRPQLAPFSIALDCYKGTPAAATIKLPKQINRGIRLRMRGCRVHLLCLHILESSGTLQCERVMQKVLLIAKSNYYYYINLMKANSIQYAVLGTQQLYIAKTYLQNLQDHTQVVKYFQFDLQQDMVDKIKQINEHKVITIMRSLQNRHIFLQHCLQLTNTQDHLVFPQSFFDSESDDEGIQQSLNTIITANPIERSERAQRQAWYKVEIAQLKQQMATKLQQSQKSQQGLHSVIDNLQKQKGLLELQLSEVERELDEFRLQTPRMFDSCFTCNMSTVQLYQRLREQIALNRDLERRNSQLQERCKSGPPTNRTGRTFFNS